MGHYASELDPSIGEPTVGERKLIEVPEDEVRNLARCLFRVFDTGSHLDATNSQHGIEVASAIDDLIRKRIAEALTPSAEAQQ